MTKCSFVCALAIFPAFAQTNTVVGAGYSAPVPLTVAPGQVVTLFVEGVGASLTQPVRAPSAGALPTMLAGISVTLKQFNSEMPVPLLSVQPVSTCVPSLSLGSCGTFTAITVQIPFEMRTLCLLCASPALPAPQLFVTENGHAGTSVDLTPLADQIHILTACDLLLPSPVMRLNLTGLPCAPMVTHGDGSLVSATNPAKAGEELVAYAVGLGATNPPMATGQRAATASPTTETFALDYNYHPNALPAKPLVFPGKELAPLFSGLTPGFVGMYQINFLVLGDTAGISPCVDTTTIPPVANAVESNLTVSFGGAFSFDGAGICVAPGS